MKKENRPGSLLTVLCAEAQATIQRDDSARDQRFGIRRTTAERRKLARELLRSKRRTARCRSKSGKLDGKVVQSAPEFEACRKLARQRMCR